LIPIKVVPRRSTHSAAGCSSITGQGEIFVKFKILALIAAMMIALFGTAGQSAAQEAEAPQARLFINLTTDDTWSAAKAIFFAHHRAMANGHETAIWLNVRAVYLAQTARPSNMAGVMVEQGSTIQDMLRAFMADGGTVIMCSACSQAAGLTQEDYIDGVVMGTWPVIENWLFAPDVRTLAW
jgi:sulfur relay (sulfurtransferase) complex TusBCD TusD component (DsrE family)